MQNPDALHPPPPRYRTFMERNFHTFLTFDYRFYSTRESSFGCHERLRSTDSLSRLQDAEPDCKPTGNWNIF